MAQTHGNKLKAAKILGIHRPTLYNKMKRYGIGCLTDAILPATTGRRGTGTRCMQAADTRSPPRR